MLAALWSQKMLWFVYSLQGEVKLQESKLQFQRLNYPSTPQKPKWKFVSCFNHALQCLKSNFLFQETDWLERCQIHCEDYLTILLKICTWTCCSVSPLLSYKTINDHPQAEVIITFDWKVIIETPNAKLPNLSLMPHQVSWRFDSRAF